MDAKEKRMVAGRRCRREIESLKNKREKYVFILRKYLPLGQLDILVSTNKKLILEKAQELLKKLPEEVLAIHIAMPFHHGKTDAEIKQYLKDNPDSTYYGIVIYNNTTGEVVDSVIVTDKTTLPAY